MGPEASVHTWDLSGHVAVIETRTTEGDESVLSLDSDILFAFGSAELSSTAATTIGTLIGDIPDAAAVSVTGHTDDIGSDGDNLVLSQQRAEAVAAAIRAARGDLVLQVEGRGETEPVESNAEDAGRKANRRVEGPVRGLTLGPGPRPGRRPELADSPQESSRRVRP